MIRFNSDYLEGAHPLVLKKLVDTNMEQTPGYGEDDYCKQAAERMKILCKQEQAAVHFLVGGTQTNTIVISSILRPYQGVIAAESGHISTHETGAIEAKGHKVLTLPSTDGKINALQVKELVKGHFGDESFEHTVQPKMVYISNPTEYGTIYSKQELEALSAVCKQYELYLFLDGARLGYGLASKENDLDLPTISKNCDVFYIGGTKVGALFGEAVIITNPCLMEGFRYCMKQHGGLLAKGRVLGLMFLALFEDHLYFQIAAHAAALADKLRQVLEDLKVPFKVDSPTNQLFPILPDSVVNALKDKFAFATIEKEDSEHTCIRFCTSWATKEEDVKALTDYLKQVIQ